MIIPYAFALSQNFLIDSCVSFREDVFNLAMLFIQTVFFGFAVVSSYKLYHYFHVYLFPKPKKASLTQQVMTTPTTTTTRSNNDVVSIAVQHGVNAEGQLYRLKRGTKLHIVPGSSLLGRHVALYCNYPVTGESLEIYWTNIWCFMCTINWQLVVWTVANQIINSLHVRHLIYNKSIKCTQFVCFHCSKIQKPKIVSWNSFVDHFCLNGK